MGLCFSNDWRAVGPRTGGVRPVPAGADRVQGEPARFTARACAAPDPLKARLDVTGQSAKETRK